MDIRDKGYDREEQYFHKQNQELLAKKRAELDAERRERRAQELKEKHWLRCPKCGHEMAEEELSGIMVDRCGTCHGLYFDAGELELLLAAKEPQGFLSGLKKLIS